MATISTNNHNEPKDIQLISNCYTMKLTPKTIYHYRFEVENIGKDIIKTLNRKLALRDIFWKLVKDKSNGELFNMPKNHIVFDDEINVFTTHPFLLHWGKIDGVAKIMVSQREHSQTKATFTFISEMTIDSNRTMSFETKRMIQNILTQHLRMPFRTTDNWFFVANKGYYRPADVKSKFYTDLKTGKNEYINSGIVINVRQNKDKQVQVVTDLFNRIVNGIPTNLIDLYESHFEVKLTPDFEIDPKSKRIFQILLEDARLSTIYDDNEYLFRNIHTKNSETMMFKNRGRLLTVKEYMKLRYNIDLKYPNLQLAVVKPAFGRLSEVHIPLELLKISTHPCSLQYIESFMQSKIIAITARDSHSTFKLASELFRESGIKDNVDVMENFGIEFENTVDAKMIRLNAKVLPKFVSTSDRHMTVHQTPGTIVVYPMFLLQGLETYPALRFDVKPLYFFTNKNQLLCHTDNLFIRNEAPKNRMNLALFVLDKESEIYAEMKLRSTFVLSQCVLLDTLKQLYNGDKGKQIHDKPLFKHLIKKINSRMGGQSQVILRDNRYISNKEFNLFVDEGTMFVGISSFVSHRYEKNKIPSILAMTFNMDKEGARYAGVFKYEEFEKARLDPIFKQFGDCFYTSLKQHCIELDRTPNHIVVLRNCVSASVVDEVSEYEVALIKAQILKFSNDNNMKWNPGFAYLSVSRKHGVRFYDYKNEQNPEPGTVIERTVIERPNDFFIYPHFGYGTLRPTLYQPYENTLGSLGTSSRIQTLSYGLSHLVGRSHCNTALPAPLHSSELLKLSCLRNARTSDNPARDFNYDQFDEEVQKLMYF